ncbi:MAG TPA: hypothetical protein VFO49_15100 [Nocardioides sp.]|nr:hypothetical protein [Nocardioides sp.]
MEMHEVLRGLVEQLGPEVFDDPDNFRGALDDVLDEEASLGEQNLVVDAVRLGAYASMVTMLGQGGAPASTVAQAGAMLARDRGGHDRASASWACACLAYAIGAVDEAEVRRYRTAQAPPPPAYSPPPPAPPPTPVPAPLPVAEPTRPRGQRLVPLLVAVAVLLAAAAGVVGASLLSGDDDAPGTNAASDPPTSSAPTEPTSPTTSPPTTSPTTQPTTEPPPGPPPVTTTVQYTCGSSGTGDCFLSERVSPDAATELIANHDEGSTIRVECQVVGQAVSSSVLDTSSRVWARTTDGGYVAAIFLSGIDKFRVTTPCS